MLSGFNALAAKLCAQGNLHGLETRASTQTIQSSAYVVGEVDNLFNGVAAGTCKSLQLTGDHLGIQALQKRGQGFQSGHWDLEQCLQAGRRTESADCRVSCVEVCNGTPEVAIARKHMQHNLYSLGAGTLDSPCKQMQQCMGRRAAAKKVSKAW